MVNQPAINIVVDEINDSSELIFTFNKKHQITYMNKSAEKISGGVNGRPESINKIFPAETAAKYINLIDEAFSAGGTHEVTMPVEFDSGRIWLETHFMPIKNGKGEIGKVMMVSRNITSRIRNKEEDVYKESRLAGIVRSIPGGVIFLLDKDFRFSFCEGAGLSKAGLSSGMLKGKSIYEMLAFDMAVDLEKRLKNVFAGDTVSFEGKHNGEYYMITAAPMSFENDPDCYIIALAVNITHRKAVETKLQESEEKYHSLFLNMVEGFAHCRMIYVNNKPEDFIYLDVNPAFEKLTGLKDVEGKYVTEIIPGIKESNPEILEAYSHTALTGEPAQFETKIDNLDLWLSISVYSPQKEHFVAVFENITARKKMEAELTRSEALLSQTQAMSQIGGWEYLAASNKMIWTSEVYKIHELEKEEPISVEDGINFYAEEFRGKINNAFNNCVIYGEPFDLELQIVSAKQNRIWVRSVGVAERKNGKTERVYGMFININDKKKAELEKRLADERMSRMVEELQKSTKELEQFAFRVSKDLQKPLRNISENIHLLENRLSAEADNKANSYLAAAAESANRMHYLLNDLLEYSRIAAVSKPYREADCSQIAGQAIINLQFLISDSRAVVITDKLPKVNCDEGLMVKVFQNIIENSIIYRGEETPRIHISAEIKDGTAEFVIADNGRGFDPKESERMFRIFERLDNTGNAAGTGMGLAVCRKIIEKHGGRIWAESEPGKGTKIHFELGA